MTLANGRSLASRTDAQNAQAKYEAESSTFSSRLFGTALFLPLFNARRPTPPLVVHTLLCLAKPDKKKEAEEKKKKKGRPGAGGRGRLLDEDHPRQHKVEEAQRVDGEDLTTCGQSGSLEEVDRGFGKRRAGTVSESCQFWPLTRVKK